MLLTVKEKGKGTREGKGYQKISVDILHLKCLLDILMKMSNRQLIIRVWNSRRRSGLRLYIWEVSTYNGT